MYATVPPEPNATELASVPLNVNVFCTLSVLPLVNVNVPVVADIVKPLTLVAEATPSVGVTSVGLVANTTAPDPVVPLLRFAAAI